MCFWFWTTLESWTGKTVKRHRFHTLVPNGMCVDRRAETFMNAHAPAKELWHLTTEASGIFCKDSAQKLFLHHGPLPYVFLCSPCSVTPVAPVSFKLSLHVTCSSQQHLLCPHSTLLFGSHDWCWHKSLPCWISLVPGASGHDVLEVSSCISVPAWLLFLVLKRWKPQGAALRSLFSLGNFISSNPLTSSLQWLFPKV